MATGEGREFAYPSWYLWSGLVWTVLLPAAAILGVWFVGARPDQELGRWLFLGGAAALLVFGLRDFVQSITTPHLLRVTERGIVGYPRWGEPISIDWVDLGSLEPIEIPGTPGFSAEEVLRIRSHDHSRTMVIHGDISGYEELKRMLFAQLVSRRPGAKSFSYPKLRLSHMADIGLVVVILAATAAGAAFVRPFPGPPWLPWGVVLAFGGLLWLEVRKLVLDLLAPHRFVVTDQSITGHPRLGTAVQIGWDEVESVERRPHRFLGMRTGAEELRIRARDGRRVLVIVATLPGYEELRRLVLEHVAADQE